MAGRSFSEEEQAEDDGHAQAAVLEIQQEMNAMKQQQQPVVDHTPADEEITTTATTTTTRPYDDDDNQKNNNNEQDDPSLQVLVTTEDLSRDTGPSTGVRDEQDLYDDENEMAYGPVVDHLPSSSSSSLPFGRQESLLVQVVQETPEEEALLDANSAWDEDDEDELNEIDLQSMDEPQQQQQEENASSYHRTHLGGSHTHRD